MTGSRSLNSNTLTASQSAAGKMPVVFAKLRFDTGNVLIHSTLGNLSFGGDTYIGVGKFGSIGTTEEVSDLSRTPLTLTLNGIPNDVISIALGSANSYQGRLATLYLGYLDQTTMQLVDTPAIVYQGNMDVMTIQQDKNCAVTISLESRFANWDTPVIRRYNNADQRARYPNDAGLQFVVQATSTEVIWGAAL